tara:strand:+ start:1765 stop:2349 length:585 start_codon:yes stop_codon:yes gene_type:complete
MVRGGVRQGAGRKPGSGKYGEETVVMRVPKSYAAEVKKILLKFPKSPALEPGSVKVEEVFKPLMAKQQLKTLYASRVAAGSPVAATDDSEATLDLNEHLMKNPEATFFVRVNGDSMIDAGINPDDLLVVDRSLAPGSGKIVIAAVNGELTVKRLFRKNGKLFLMPENPLYPSIEVTQETDFMIWGVVTNVIHSL